MTAKQPNDVSAGNIKSIDNLLDDIQQEQNSDARSPRSSGADGNVSRRRAGDRREAPVKKPRSTVERRLEDDRRAESAALRQTKQSLSELQAEQKLQQHRKKILLAGCEPVMGLNYNSLAMDDYPDNALVAEARRDRDYWIVVCSVCCFSLVY